MFLFEFMLYTGCQCLNRSSWAAYWMSHPYRLCALPLKRLYPPVVEFSAIPALAIALFTNAPQSTRPTPLAQSQIMAGVLVGS
jgi:hypothetical protein